MNHLLKVLMFVGFGYILPAYGAQAAPIIKNLDCEVIELVEGNLDYNRLVCEGVRHMQQGHPVDAGLTFEKAMRMPLFEFPNFKLYPRLALSYFRAGNRDKAKETLKKSELALSVLIGSAYCKETEKGFRLVKQEGIAPESHYESEIARRMCGAAYEYVYSQRSFEIVLHNARLIEAYVEAKKEIDNFK